MTPAFKYLKKCVKEGPSMLCGVPWGRVPMGRSSKKTDSKEIFLFHNHSCTERRKAGFWGTYTCSDLLGATVGGLLVK